MFITQYGADGINLDFEPYRTDSATEANYIGMFSAVRNAIGPKVNLSLDYTTDPDYTWSAAVSYTHLDVYKRQYVGGAHVLLAPNIVPRVCKRVAIHQ